ncbi:putative zinc-binding dehydrogenase family oxidoreductase [Bombardia bombarda]|uniref:Zinc-binding dehydrogenase family oxidoreductase n=1 Tax=Bombardia bombarda TaxID=252184 RepID=A0AA40CA67_9PEZI|nr:putative zinc-binding dehydrogenase family oxidoreductase [Bombardia bombarda]
MAVTAFNNIPATRKGFLQDANGRPYLTEGIPMPVLTTGNVLIKTNAVALNPSDYKMCAAFPAPGAVLGLDFSGTVVAIGPDTDTDLALGDVVFGSVHGSNPANLEQGAFTEYLVTQATPLLRVPKKAKQPLSIQEAASFGTALATCTLALWGPDALNLPHTPDNPSPTPTPVLVYGGSTATGSIAIQLLKLSGYAPIATSSPRNFELVKSYGATAVFDYMHSDVAGAIKKHTGGRLRHVMDCIADVQSVETCFDAMARVGGRYATLELVPDELLARRRAVRPEFAPDPGKMEHAIVHFDMYQRLFDEGRLRTHPIQMLEGGFDAILPGLALLKSGEVSGRKLVVTL